MAELTTSNIEVFDQHTDAHFHSTEEITALLENAGFTNFSYWQTLINYTENEIEQPKQGFEDGSFVVIKAQKQYGN
jgi:hypothetical protein